MKKLAKAYKTEIAPTKEQQQTFDEWMRTARFVWNRALDVRSAAYKRDKTSMSMMGKKGEKEKTSLQYYFQQLRDHGDDRTPPEAIEALAAVPTSLVLGVLLNQNRSFSAFFKTMRGYPKFKTKRQNSFKVYGGVRIEHARIKLPKIGWIKLKEKGYLPTPDKLPGEDEKLISATISRRAGRWFVSVSVYEMHEPPKVKSDKVVAVHPGVRQFITTSDGHTIKGFRDAIHAERKKLNRWKRRKSKRKKGSQNRKKAILQIQKIEARIANIRAWHTHNASFKIASNGLATLVLQQWDVKDMMKHTDGKKHNRRLRQAISDSNFYELRRQLTYKAEWNGKEVVTLEKSEPVTKRCSGCGHVKEEFPLWKKIYTCDKCGLTIDREENAVRNMLFLYENMDNVA